MPGVGNLGNIFDRGYPFLTPAQGEVGGAKNRTVHKRNTDLWPETPSHLVRIMFHRAQNFI